MFLHNFCCRIRFYAPQYPSEFRDTIVVAQIIPYLALKKIFFLTKRNSDIKYLLCHNMDSPLSFLTNGVYNLTLVVNQKQLKIHIPFC